MRDLTSVRLTRRERDMIQGVIEGKKNKEIAYQLGIADNTVKVYMSRLFEKVGANDRWSLGIWGRAFAESERLTNERYAEMRAEQNPDEPPLPAAPAFLHTELARFDVFRVMAQTIEMTHDQAFLISKILFPSIHSKGGG